MNLIDQNENLKDLIYEIPGMFYLCHPCQENTINFTQKTTKAANASVDNINTNSTLTPTPITTIVTRSPKQTPVPSPTKITTDLSSDISIPSLRRRSKSLPTDPRDLSLPRIPITPIVIVDNNNEKTNRNLDDFNHLGRTDFMKKRFLREIENNTKLTSKSTAPEQSDKSKDLNKTHNTPPTCRFYVKGKCKHGIRGKNCQYNHPKACPKLMKYGNKGPRGCNAGANCAQFHPRMCSSSITSGACFNIQCTFAHVKGTKIMPKKSDPPPKNHSDTNDSVDFLKILDNFRLQMISFINESLKPPPQAHPAQEASKLDNQQRYQPQVTIPPSHHKRNQNFSQLNQPLNPNLWMMHH